MAPKKPTDKDQMEWSEEVAQMIKDKFHLGEGPDVVIEVTGAEPCIQTGIHLCKKGGTFVQAGMGVEVSSTLVELNKFFIVDIWPER